ncbi:F0F1 ATP synthase subunit B [Anaerovorax odorimutans]|uniref:F0F1 ATP synthase subunit B n=1 Tax=Anaerovorax odorimutans TaxID=109327 RepID=UPI0006848090|nr:F0F1 ATP synthase subunit B [Anaerovorax odorimutans]
MRQELIEFSWTLPMVAITMIILYLIMKHFFFEKVHNFMLARQNLVVEAFEQADETNRMADEKLLEYNNQIEGLENEGREIIKKAKIKAESQAKVIVDEANKKAGELLLQAEKEIERERLKAINEMRQQITGLAIYAAEKILEKQLQEAGQDEIIEKIIEQAGKSEWQS